MLWVSSPPEDQRIHSVCHLLLMALSHVTFSHVSCFYRRSGGAGSERAPASQLVCDAGLRSKLHCFHILNFGLFSHLIRGDPASIDHLLIQLQVFADSFWESIGCPRALRPPSLTATALLQHADWISSRDAVQLSALGWRNFFFSLLETKTSPPSSAFLLLPRVLLCSMRCQNGKE